MKWKRDHPNNTNNKNGIKQNNNSRQSNKNNNNNKNNKQNNNNIKAHKKEIEGSKVEDGLLDMNFNCGEREAHGNGLINTDKNNVTKNSINNMNYNNNINKNNINKNVNVPSNKANTTDLGTCTSEDFATQAPCLTPYKTNLECPIDSLIMNHTDVTINKKGDVTINRRCSMEGRAYEDCPIRASCVGEKEELVLEDSSLNNANDKRNNILIESKVCVDEVGCAGESLGDVGAVRNNHGKVHAYDNNSAYMGLFEDGEEKIKNCKMKNENSTHENNNNIINNSKNNGNSSMLHFQSNYDGYMQWADMLNDAVGENLKTREDLCYSGNVPEM